MVKEDNDVVDTQIAAA